MAAIPVRFRRVAAAFDEAVARVRPCESSGSEHSAAESPTDLYDLVASFMEREGRAHDYYYYDKDNDDDEVEGSNENKHWFYSEAKDVLEEVFGLEGKDEDVGKQKIRLEVENALRNNKIGDRFSKRDLMVYLREKGFDAGLCKSKWEKNGKKPAGDYQYIDVNINQTRYIVEVFLAGQFEIARPSARYKALLDLFPPIFVDRPEELKRVVRVMSPAIKHSMRSNDLLMPPWRRNAYMQSQWLASYKRTTNKVTQKTDASYGIGFEANRAVGFQAFPEILIYGCRDDFARKSELRIGQLTETFGGS